MADTEELPWSDWFAEAHKALAQTTRRDETALHAKISELTQQVEQLRARVKLLESALNAEAIANVRKRIDADQQRAA
jgi:cell division protein FtsB